MPNAHDLIPYPALPFPRTHPVALSAFAALFGKPYVPFAACRVLEIGCGAGVNIANMALGAPASEFVGIDLAEQPIARAKAAAEASGLRNLRFELRDILEMDASFGRFDYIIAHGVYAWVPPVVGKALMRLAGQLLTENGLALISYNAYPGCHFRQAVRDLMLNAARGIAEPREWLAAARAALAGEAEAWSEAHPLQAAMVFTARDLLEKPPEVLFHDELTGSYEPRLLSEVIASARENDLTYLCDAQPHLSEELLLPTEKYAALRAQAAGDWGRFEQFMDFREMRAFRSSIFCRGEGFDRRFEPQRLRGLWASCDLRPLDPDPAAPDSFAFQCEGKARLTTNNPKLARFLAELAATFPASVALDELAEDPALAKYFLNLLVANMVRLSTAPPSLTLAPGDRPLASPLARFQAQRGETTLASLRHYPVSVEDEATRAFLGLLDGTRTREDLAREIAPLAGAGSAETQVAQALAELARLGLMAG